MEGVMARRKAETTEETPAETTEETPAETTEETPEETTEETPEETTEGDDDSGDIGLIRMTRDENEYPAPHTADVHPDEVENMTSGGWRVVEDKDE
jgi:hypothetical protein